MPVSVGLPGSCVRLGVWVWRFGGGWFWIWGEASCLCLDVEGEGRGSKIVGAFHVKRCACAVPERDRKEVAVPRETSFLEGSGRFVGRAVFHVERCR